METERDGGGSRAVCVEELVAKEERGEHNNNGNSNKLKAKGPLKATFAGR